MKKQLIIAATATLLALCGCNSSSNGSSAATTTTVAIAELNDEQFAQMVGTPAPDGSTWNFASDKPIVVDFHATWCGPCKKLAPNVQQLANEMDGKLTVYKVDVDKARQTAGMFGINSVPTVLFFNPTTKQLAGQSGYMELTDLKAHVKEALGVE